MLVVVRARPHLGRLRHDEPLGQEERSPLRAPLVISLTRITVVVLVVVRGHERSEAEAQGDDGGRDRE